MKHRDKPLGTGVHVPCLADQRVAAGAGVGADQKRRAAVNFDAVKLPQHILKIGKSIREENILDGNAGSIRDSAPLLDDFRAVLLMKRKMHSRELHAILQSHFDAVITGEGRCQVEANVRQLANLRGKLLAMLSSHFVRGALKSDEFQHGGLAELSECRDGSLTVCSADVGFKKPGSNRGQDVRMSDSGDVTRILNSLEQGESHSADELLPLVYDELRKLAAARLAQERAGQSLQATALVHDAWLRLVDVRHQQRWDSRGHFFAAAAEAMRRILVEWARQRGRLKHGGEFQRVDLPDEILVGNSTCEDVLALDEALTKLESQQPEKAQLVKLRFFAGLTIEQTAESLGISTSTADRHWVYARAWLFREISGKSPES